MEETPNDQSSFSYWILEFLLRQPIRNSLLHAIFLALNFPSNPTPQIPSSLIKSILLRRIASNPISLRSLSSLELLHQLNLHDPDAHLIQLAYCHIAVGSTLPFLVRGDEAGFLDAVERIWIGRVGDLEASEGTGLVSEGLMYWKWRIEMAVGSERAREEVVKEWRAGEGLAAVRDFLVKELEVMGPTRLETVAREVVEGKKDENLIDGGGLVGMRGNDEKGGCIVNEEGNVSNGLGVHEEARHGQGEVGSSLQKIDNDDCNTNEETEPLDGLSRADDRIGERRPEVGKVGVSLTGVGGGNCLVIDYKERSDALGRGEERTVEQVEQWEVRIRLNGVDNSDHIANGEDKTEHGFGEDEERNGGQVEQRRGFDFAKISNPTQEVKTVKENLKRSREDLKNIVVDPLPCAKMAAARVTESKSMKVLHRQEQDPENQNIVDVSAPSHSSNKGSGCINFEPKKDLKVSGHSLLDRNPTARTYEWEDESIESPSDNSSSSLRKFHLSTPRPTKVSPLKRLEVRKVARKRKKWSVEEEDALREAVNKHGKGNWKIILNDNRDAFRDRTEVDLKDKWRNMTKP